MITNVCSKPVKFLGVEIRMVKKNGKWVNRVSPESERFKRKMKDLSREIFYIRKTSTLDADRLIENINRVNSIIVGLINYYSMCDQISVVIRKYAWLLKYTAYKSLKRYGGQWIRANEISNLIGLHYGHKAHEARFHHVDKKLPMSQMNKVKNLITVHQYCHDLIHSNTEPTSLSEKTLKNIAKYRKKLN